MRTDASPAATPRALLGVGSVRHARLRPVSHAFTYPTFFLLLPMRRLRDAPDPALPRNRWGWVSFHDADHGDGRNDSLAWFDALLASEGITDADGEVWLHCLPRMLGHTFKPVSFWYAHRRDGTLAAAVAEVNNTFGERHCYVMHGPGLGWAREQQATKVMHVSPFCRPEGRYRFRFHLRTDGGAARTVVRIEHDDAQGPLLRASVSGRLQPLDRPALRGVLWRMPLLTLGVVARIHWQALRLWWRGVPVVAHTPRHALQPRPASSHAAAPAATASDTPTAALAPEPTP